MEWKWELITSTYSDGNLKKLKELWYWKKIGMLLNKITNSSEKDRCKTMPAVVHQMRVYAPKMLENQNSEVIQYN